MNSKQSSKRTSSGWLGCAIRLLAVALAVIALSVPVFSQGTFGRITGTVTDQSGGTVAGAQVSVVDTDRGVTRTLTTDDAGEYNAPNLTPGTYTVRVEAKGFKRIERQNVVLEVGKEVRVDLIVQPGEQEQTVTVTEAVPLVETTNATLGGALENSEINDMPLNGRNYQNLLALRPGVMLQPGGGPWTQSTNGIRPDETVWMLDGVINVNMYDARPVANMPSPFSDGATILPVDAIQEFNTEISPKAEYGWKPGAVVNAGVKSGTNQIHGSIYGFYRSAAWDARNLFNPTPQSAGTSCLGANAFECDKTPVQLKQFGAVVGGPIKKDKLFYFGGYEGLRSLIGNAIVTGGVPETNSTGDPSSSMVDAIMALQAKGIPISPVSLALSGCPSGTLTTSSVCTPPNYSWPVNTTGNTSFTAHFPNTNITDNGIGKLDYRLNDKNSINGMVMIGRYTGVGMDHPFVNQIFRDTNLDHTYTVGADWVYSATSRLVNDARFGWNRIWFNFLTDDGTKLSDGTASGYPVDTGVTQFPGLPNINLSGFEKLGSWHNRPQNWNNEYSDIQDNLSYLMGKHTLKFGAEFAIIDVQNAIPDTGRGLIAFKGNQLTSQGITDCKKGTKSCPLEDFFAGYPSGGNLLSGSANREEKWNSYAGYVQDDWRINPRLTLNLGLRYSYVTPIHEVNSLWGSFDPAQGMIQQPSNGSLYHADNKDFSPRLGFAYDLDGKGTTVVRGNFSILYSFITAVTFLNQNGFTAPGATSLALPAVPTGAIIETNGLGTGTAGSGTINLQSAALGSKQLCWDATIVGSCPVTGGTSLNGGKVFPAPVAACGDGVGLDAAPCSIMAVDPNLTTPYITNWSLGVQHSIGNDLSLEIGYVGDHGARLTGFRDLNQTQLGPGGTVIRPYGTAYPYLQWIYQLSNDGRSNFHSLQATLTKRTSHGLSFMAGYTYSHGLDTGSLNRTGYLPQDSTNVEGEYASGDFDVRHRFTFTTSYAIPGIKGYGQMLEGWKLNAIVTAQSAQPWQTYDSNNDFLGGDFVDRWNIFGNPGNFTSGPNGIPFCSGPGANGCGITSGISGQTTFYSAAQSTAMWNECVAHADPAAVSGLNATLAANGCYVSPNGQSFITPPANHTYGNMGRNIFRDSGFKDVDFSVFKNFSWKERYTAEFRVEFFNILNHPISANPYGSANGYGVGNDPSVGANGGGIFGCGCATADVAAGSPQIGSGGARAMQIGLKLAF